MRRFSQRSHLVTLSEINITPLLDLAFVLLIIFIITTPLLERSLPLRLPRGGQQDATFDLKDIRTIEISQQGYLYLDKQPIRPDQLERQLLADFHYNPDLIVYIRADENGLNKHLYAVIDLCQRNGITRFSLRTQPHRTR